MIPWCKARQIVILEERRVGIFLLSSPEAYSYLRFWLHFCWISGIRQVIYLYILLKLSYQIQIPFNLRSRKIGDTD